jgi:hypothetical protein
MAMVKTIKGLVAVAFVMLVVELFGTWAFDASCHLTPS